MKTELVESPIGDFGASLKVQVRVLRALMLRQALGRFGRDNLGVFWIFAEPLLLSSAVMIMWTAAGMNKGHGVAIVPFVLSSYSLLTLWRHMIGQSVRPLRANMDLLYHRNIRLLDILIARASLESIAGFAAFAMAYGVLYVVGFMREFDDALLVAGAWLFLTWFGWSFGLFIAGITEIFEPAEHFVQPVMYTTLPVTGAFYMVLWMPQTVQDVLMWSPLVHIFEMFRAGIFGAQYAADWNALYITIWCVTLMVVGLPLLRLGQMRFSAG